MIQLSAQIDLVKDVATSATIDGKGNNISESLENIKTKRETKNPFILGASKLGENATFESKVDYFIGSLLSDSNGIFSPAYNIDIDNSQPLESLTISFDTANDRHPNSISLGYYIDGVEYSKSYNDNDSIFTIIIPENATDLSIKISNWNAPNFPLVISGIYVGITLNINKKNLISFNQSIFSRDKTDVPSYGVISNNGQINFKDLDGEIEDYANQLLLNDGLKIVVSLNNSLLKKSEKIGVFKTNEWDYDNDIRAVSLTFRDDLTEWQSIEISKMALKSKMTALEMYNYLKSKTPTKWDFEQLDEYTMHFLESYIIRYPYLESGNLWSQWTKLCVLCALHIYKNKEDKVVVVHDFRS